MADRTGAGDAAFSRRDFIRTTSFVGAGLVAGASLARAGAAPATRPSTRPTTSPSRKVIVGVMGTSRSGGDRDLDGRGTHLAATLASLPGVEVAYVCDVDERNVGKAIDSVSKKKAESAKPPQGVRDFRRILDDKNVDALVVATPDHWHAPAAILGCSAGKHVYVEKPCCHNAAEGQLLVDAARKHKRLVQHGTQRRSWPAIQEAVQRLRAGDIGRLMYAKCLYFGPRPTIGNGKAAPVPSWLDWSMWQGPAPEKEFRDNYVHYNWHWFWHWGTGELGNNGVHSLDLARWGMGVDYPRRITSAGGKYRYPKDDQETPDLNVVTYDFGGKSITWECKTIVGRNKSADGEYENAFYGDKGSLLVNGGGYTLYDPAGKEIDKHSGNGGDAVHLQNFVDAVRDEAKLNAEIEEGYKSALLCHLGNIAYRTGGATRFDPKTKELKAGAKAKELWGREYRKGWEPVV